MIDVSRLVIEADSRQVRNAGKDLDNLSRKSDKTERRVGSLKGAFVALGGAMILREMAMTINSFERLNGMLKTATGSADNASVAFDKLEEFASQTPYTLDQAVRGFVKLKNLGLDPSERALNSYGNTATAMGKQLDDMVEAVADATTGEFERLKEFGIKAKTEGDRVKFTFQGVTTEVGKNAEEIEEYLMRIGEVNFAGAMEDQMESLPGLVAQVKNSIGALWRTIGNAGVTEFMREGLRTLNNIIGITAESLEELTESSGDLGDDTRLIDWGNAVATAFAWVADSAVSVKRVIDFIMNAIGKAIGAFAAQISFLVEGEFKKAARVGNSYKDDLKNMWADFLDQDFSTFRDNTSEMIEEQEKAARTVEEGNHKLVFSSKEAADAFREEQKWINMATESLKNHASVASSSGTGTGGDTSAPVESDAPMPGADPYTGRDLMKIQDTFMAEEELLRQNHTNKQLIVEDAFNQMMVSQQERNALIQGLEKQHQQAILNIGLDAHRQQAKFDRDLWKQKVDVASNGFQQLTAGTAQYSREMFELNKAAATANALVNAPEAASAAYKWGAAWGGPAGGAAAAATALYAQYQKVKAIQSTGFAGGGGGTTPSSAGSTPVVNNQPEQQQSATAQEQSAQSVFVDLGGQDDTKLTVKQWRELYRNLQEEAGDMQLRF